MRKSLLITIICILTTTKVLVGQITQSISLSGPAQIPAGPTTFTVSVSLTFDGYSAVGLSYWVQVDSALAPFLSLTNVQYFTFPDPNQTTPNPAPFNHTTGADAGYMSALRDLGANFPNFSNMVGPGTYHITDLTFQLAPGNPGGSHTLAITTLGPLISLVDDTEIGVEHALPAASFTFNVVPEPSTIAFLVVAAILALLVRHKGG
jgi:hypothetical protein